MTQPVWSDSNLGNPHALGDKAERVRAMFDAIAPSYDLNNRVHSLGRDQAWRRAAVAEAQLRAGDEVLDVACGTGDLTLAFARWRDQQGRGPGKVVGLDFTEGMLAIARRKAGPLPPSSSSATPVEFLAGDAMRLPFPDGSFDVVSIAFGIRNVADPARAAAEFHRVLRPGGRVVVLEFSLPRNAVLRGLYNLYFRHVLPRTATWIARDRTGAYKYLPQSVNTFIGREQMAAMLAGAGFASVATRTLTLGIAMVYRAVKTGMSEPRA